VLARTWERTNHTKYNGTKMKKITYVLVASGLLLIAINQIDEARNTMARPDDGCTVSTNCCPWGNEIKCSGGFCNSSAGNWIMCDGVITECGSCA